MKYLLCVRSFMALSLLLAVLMGGCQLPTPPSGFDIPKGVMPQREPTYDDIDATPGGLSYRGNGHEEGKMPEWKSVDEVDLSLANDLHIDYRNYIETQAEQIRYNIIYTGFRAVDLKLSSLPPADIQVKEVGTPPKVHVLMMEIPPQITPGDYKIGFQVYVDGQYRGDLPCTIHVIE